MSELKRRDDEIERLRAELAKAHAEYDGQCKITDDVVAERDAAREQIKNGLRSEAIAFLKQRDDMRTALDEQTRFLAGINLQDHPKREQIDRAAQVHRAMELLKPNGARVDNATMDAAVIRERVRDTLTTLMKGKTLAEVGGVTGIAQAIANVLPNEVPAHIHDDGDKINVQVAGEFMQYLPKERLLRLNFFGRDGMAERAIAKMKKGNNE